MKKIPQHVRLGGQRVAFWLNGFLSWPAMC